MTKVVINCCYGGFGLSQKAMGYYRDHGGKAVEYWDIDRDDHVLVKTVEDLGSQSWGAYAKLKVVNIPDDISWYVHEYDGMEEVHEDHRTWS